MPPPRLWPADWAPRAVDGAVPLWIAGGHYNEAERRWEMWARADRLPLASPFAGLNASEAALHWYLLGLSPMPPHGPHMVWGVIWVWAWGHGPAGPEWRMVRRNTNIPSDTGATPDAEHPFGDFMRDMSAMAAAAIALALLIALTDPGALKRGLLG